MKKQDGGYAVIGISCLACKEPSDTEVYRPQLEAYMHGNPAVQDIFPEASPEDREIIRAYRKAVRTPAGVPAPYMCEACTDLLMEEE
jgi:hypothetical protein